MSAGPQLLSVADLAARFKRGTRWAAARMAEMRHVVTGGRLFTTEEWLAEWLAAESVPQKNWPKANYDPLEEVVDSRAIQVIGAWFARGWVKFDEAKMAEAVARAGKIVVNAV